MTFDLTDATIESFGEAAQADFKRNLAAVVRVDASAIELNITAGSLIVTASIRTADAGEQAAVMATLRAQDEAALETALQVALEAPPSVQAAMVVVTAPSPPSPPSPPPGAPLLTTPVSALTSSSSSSSIMVAVAVSIASLAALVGLGLFAWRRHGARTASERSLGRVAAPSKASAGPQVAHGVLPGAASQSCAAISVVSASAALEDKGQCASLRCVSRC